MSDRLAENKRRVMEFYDLMFNQCRPVRKGRMTVPLGEEPDLAHVGGLPWCSTATIQAKEEKLHRVVGPAISQTTGWALPIFPFFPDPATGLNEYEKDADKLRKAWGLNAAGASDSANNKR
jgi:hypothetical protein